MASRTTADVAAIAPKNRAMEATRWESGADFFLLKRHMELGNLDVPHAMLVTIQFNTPIEM